MLNDVLACELISHDPMHAVVSFEIALGLLVIIIGTIFFALDRMGRAIPGPRAMLVYMLGYLLSAVAIPVLVLMLQDTGLITAPICAPAGPLMPTIAYIIFASIVCMLMQIDISADNAARRNDAKALKDAQDLEEFHRAWAQTHGEAPKFGRLF